MSTVTRTLAKSIYALFGIVFLVAGASVLLINTGILPTSYREFVVGFSDGNINTLHVIQELGSVLVFVGLITFWFLCHYDQSRDFHWSMTIFWALFALAHWFHVAGPPESAVGPLITTVPFLLFLVIGALQVATDGRKPRSEAGLS